MKMFCCCSGYCWACAINLERTGVECMAGPLDDFYVPFNPVKEAKRLADRGDFDPPENRDDCVRCEGRNGGAPGNENMIDGEPVCDYCMDKQTGRMNIPLSAYTLDHEQRLQATVKRLRSQGAKVWITRTIQQKTYLHISVGGTSTIFFKLIMPAIHKDFPEAYRMPGTFLSMSQDPDPYMKVTISLNPRGESMKTVYQSCDGEIFEDQGMGAAHENKLFDDWLDSLITGRINTKLTDVIRHFNDTPELSGNSEDEHHGTPWDVLKEALKTYWESL